MEYLTQILYQLRQPVEWWSINIEFTSNDTGNFYAIKLKRKKDEIEIIEKYAALLNEDNLVRITTSNIPVVISINGKGIMHKKITINENDTSEFILNQLLPGAKYLEFYIQKTKATNNIYFVSAARKQLVEKVLNLFLLKRGEVIAFSFGPFEIGGIVSFISNENTIKITANNYKLTYIDGILDNYEKIIDVQNSTYTIGDNIIESDYLIPLATGLSIASDSQSENDIQFTKNNSEEYFQKNIFNIAIKATLLLLFIVLLINFILYNRYFKENLLLNAAIKTDAESVNKINRLRKDIDEKETFLKKTGWLETSKTSYYVDRIIAAMPRNIVLQELSVYPSDKDRIRKEQNEMIFQNNRIFIRGIVQESSVLNVWIDALKAMKWINEVKIDKYYMDEQSSSGVFEITIEKK